MNKSVEIVVFRIYKTFGFVLIFDRSFGVNFKMYCVCGEPLESDKEVSKLSQPVILYLGQKCLFSCVFNTERFWAISDTIETESFYLFKTMSKNKFMVNIYEHEHGDLQVTSHMRFEAITFSPKSF